MSNQIQITGGAKVRNLNGVLTGTSGVVSSVPLGAANGVATLDSAGKVPLSQLPSSVITYLGTWNAATNTPTLVNGTGDDGDLYICNVAGTVNFGAGPITFYVSDWVIYGSGTWQRSSGATGTVTSVGLTSTAGAFTISNSPISTSGDISLNFSGNSGQYVSGDGNLVTFPTIITQAQNLVTEVYNSTGATLSKGTVVYINGGHGNLPTVAKAIATSDATSAQTYGVVRADITNNNNGYVTVFGNIDNLDTQAYSDGTQLYLSGTTAGAWTSTKPSAPIHLVYVGIVTRSHPTQGVVEIRIQNGYELGELHDVSITSVANNDGIFYNSSNDLWENKTIAEVLGYTPLGGSGTAGNVPYYTAANTLGSENGFMYDSSTNRFGVNTTVPNATIGANASIDSGYSLLLKNADANYNGLGFGLDSTYGNLITTQKIGTANARNFTLQNQSGYVSIDESGNFGVNILTPKGGVDIYSSTTAALYLHNSASGVAATDGVRLSLNSTNANLRNYESGTLSMTSEGDFSVITAATENFRVNSADGSIYQSKVANAMLKSVSGVITAAVAGTDYLDPSSLSGYVPTSRTISINGTTQDLSSNRSWSVGTLTGGGAAGRVAFWDGASNVVSDSLFVWDDTNNRLGIGLTNPQRALEIYSASADTHLRLSGSAPSVSMGEAITGSIYQAKFGLATANNQFVTGSVAGDFVINNQTGATIWAYNSTEKMRLDTNGNLGVGGIANSSYRLHVFGLAPMIGIESTGSGSSYLRYLQAGTVVASMYFNSSNNNLTISNNNGGVVFNTASVNSALSIASAGAATFSGDVTLSKITTATGLEYQVRNTNGASGNHVFKSYNTAILTLDGGTNAATFSSSVTLQGGSGLRLLRSTNDAYWQLYNDANDDLNIGVYTSGGTSIGTNPKVKITEGGNVGIGTTSIPYAKFNVYNNTNDATYGAKIQAVFGPADYQDSDATQNYGSGTSETQFLAGSTARPAMISLGGNVNTGEGIGVINFFRSSNTDTYRSRAWIWSGLNTTGTANQHGAFLAFSTAADGGTNPTERMRITSAGLVAINSTSATYGEIFKVVNTGASANTAFFYFDGSQDRASIISTHGGSTGTTYRNHVEWKNSSGGSVGSVAVNGTTTAYNTSSDYRLKEDLKDFDALNIMSKIKFYDFKWKSEDSRMIGVIAHELQEIIPYAVNGIKNEIDENGNDKMQGVDYSKLVAIQGKAIQELKAELDELKAKIN